MITMEAGAAVQSSILPYYEFGNASEDSCILRCSTNTQHRNTQELEKIHIEKWAQQLFHALGTQEIVFLFDQK